MIIDNVWENFQLQPYNGIYINTWQGDMSDTALIDLIPLLKDIVIKRVKDVRKTLKKFRDTMMRLFLKGDQNPYETLRKYLKN
jgi:CTD small phosphatase-like protein 2